MKTKIVNRHGKRALTQSRCSFGPSCGDHPRLEKVEFGAAGLNRPGFAGG